VLERQRAGGWAANGVWVVVAAIIGLVCTVVVLWAGPLPAVVPVVLGLIVLALGSSFWAVALFLIALPLGLTEGLVPTGPVNLVQLLAVFVVAVVALQRILSGRAPLRWHPSAGWAVALVVLVVVAAVTARDVIAAVPHVVALVVAVALALAVLAACPRWRDLRRLVLVLAVVGTGVCLYSLGGAGDIQAALPGAGVVGNRASGIFQSPNQLGTFSGLLMFVGLGLALGARTRWERVVGSACLLSATAALLISLSRGAWIGAGLGLAVFVLLSPRARRVVPAVLAAGGILIPLVLAVTAPQLFAVVAARAAALVQVDANPEDARPLIYQEAVRQIVERPWTGQGPGNYPLVLESAHSAAPSVAVLHAHNVMLQVAAEAGIPAAVLLVVFTLSVARSVLLARSRLPAPDRDLLMGLAAGLVVVMGQGLFDFTLGNPTLLFLVWTTVGLVFAATIRTEGAEPETAAPLASPAEPARA
jgi:O-antigen ligase